MKRGLCAVVLALATPASAAPADVIPAAEKTDAGAVALAIGAPVMVVAPTRGGGALAILAKQGVVIASSGVAIAVFDLATGRLTRTLAAAKPGAALRDQLVDMTVAQDGSWLVAAQGEVTRAWHWPYDKPAYNASCDAPCAVSHDGKRFACSHGQPEIRDLASGSRVAAVPGEAVAETSSCRFADDDHALIYAGGHSISRWDFASNATAPIYASKEPIEATELAPRGGWAIVVTRVPSKADWHAAVVELGSGKATELSGYKFAIDSTGQRGASATGRDITVFELATNKPIVKSKLTGVVGPMAFSDDGRLFAFVDGADLRIVDLPSGTAHTFAPASRFAGWVGPATAAIQLGAELFALALPAKTWGATDRAALSPVVAGAPTWATWNGGDVAAAPSKRHALAPDDRGSADCDRTLKVWTAKGGEKSLAMTCSKDDDHVDPGWDIGGGWAVAVGTKSVALFDPKSGKKLATLPALSAAKPKFAGSYYAMALSPTGDRLAVMWRHAIPAQVNGVRSDHEVVGDPSECDSDIDGCKQHYVVETWAIAAQPKRLSQIELDAVPTGALAFDHAGTRLLVGFASGEIRVLASGDTHVERLHNHPITRIEVAPGDGWVFSEDDAHEQRVWPQP